jgi:hypothetical protein
MDNYGLVKDLLLWWLYVDFLSVGSVGIKKIVVFVIIIIIFRAGTIVWGCALVWRGYVVGYCMILGVV